MTSENSGQVNQDIVKILTKTISGKNKSGFEKLLPEFLSMNDPTIHQCLFEICTAPDNTALFMIEKILEMKDLPSWLEAELLELTLDKAMSEPKFVLLFMSKADSDTKKAAVPVFANILINETDSHILYEVLKAVGETREKSCIDLVGEFIFYDNEELKLAAIEALEKIGGAAALKRLTFAATTSKMSQEIAAAIERMESTVSDSEDETDENINQYAAKNDSFEALKDDSDMVQLITMLNSSSPHDRHTATDLLIETGVKAIPSISANIDMTDTDSIINALNILGNIYHEAAIPSVLKILNEHHKDENVRFAVCEAMAKLSQADSVTYLIQSIEDSSEQVRIAAATAINKNLSGTLLAGIRSRIETSGRHSNRNKIIAAIIDSFSDKTFEALLNSDAFVSMVGEYLENVHESTRRFYLDILKKRGAGILARKIQEGASKGKNESGLTVFIVDNSEIMLRYYTSLFHRMGHSPKTFPDPDSLLKAVNKKKPDLVISDLNMLFTNGLQLTDKIRAKYDSSKLPVVIITTQSDFVKEYEGVGSIMPDGSISPDMNINMVLQKPADISRLKPLCCLISIR